MTSCLSTNMAAKLFLLGGTRNLVSLGRQTTFKRTLAVTSVKEPALTEEERLAIEKRFEPHYQGDEEQKKDIKNWKKIGYFFVLPFVALYFVNSMIIDHEPHVRPKFKPYTHIRIYRKPLPWRDGKGPMLFNRKMVATADGYIEPPPAHH